MQLPRPLTLAAAAAQAVQTAACPSVRYCSRRKLQQSAIKRYEKAQQRSRRHLVRALEAEAEVEEPSTQKKESEADVEEPSTQRKRGRKKNTRPTLPSVQELMLQPHCQHTSCKPYSACSQLHISRQSRTLSHLGALVCTQANMVYTFCSNDCKYTGNKWLLSEQCAWPAATVLVMPAHADEGRYFVRVPLGAFRSSMLIVVLFSTRVHQQVGPTCRYKQPPVFN